MKLCIANSEKHSINKTETQINLVSMKNKFHKQFVGCCHPKLFCSNRTIQYVYRLSFICIIYRNPDPQYHPHLPPTSLKYNQKLSPKPRKKSDLFRKKKEMCDFYQFQKVALNAHSIALC